MKHETLWNSQLRENTFATYTKKHIILV